MTSVKRNRNQQLIRLRVGDIEENPANFRDHSSDQRVALQETVRAIGWYGYPDVYQTAEGRFRLVDGALRRSHLIEQYGEDAEIRVNVTDFDERDALVALATHDRIAEMAKNDTDRLAQLIQAVQAEDEQTQIALGKVAAWATLVPKLDIEEDEPEPDQPEVEENHVRMVQLLLSPAQMERLETATATLRGRYGTENLTDTVFRAVTDAANRVRSEGDGG